MQNRTLRLYSAVFTVVLATLVVLNITSIAAAAELDRDTVRSILAAAPKEETAVPGIRLFAAPPRGFDPMAASNEELLRYGLPQRPDNTRDLAIWQRAMLAAKHRADPSKVHALPYSSTNMRRVGATAAITANQTANNSLNWSGVADTNKLTKWSNLASFDFVASVFNVPIAQPPFNACANGITGPFYEVSWNGIDGFANGDVVQGGSLSAADCSGNTAYEAWVEWFPSYSILGVFAVSPGDDMYVITYGAPGTSTQNVFVEDFTKQTFGTFSLAYVTGPGLVGSSAEWIVERPCCASNGFPLALANTIYDFFNYDFADNGAGHVFYAGSTSPTSFNITMLADDGATIIENVNSSSGATGKQGLLPLWFVDDGCAYSGGCTP